MATLRKQGKYYHIIYRENNKQRGISTKKTNRYDAEKELQKFTESRNRQKVFKNRVKVNQTVLTLDQSIDYFIHKKKLIENISPVTEKNYRKIWKLIDKSEVKYINQFTSSHFEKIIENLNVSRRSLATYSIHLKSVFSFLIKEGIYKNKNPIARIRFQESDPNPISQCDKLRLLIKSRKTNIRLYTNIGLCYYLALRASESVNFRISNIDYQSKIITIDNVKGKRRDKIPLLADTYKFLRSIKIIDSEIWKYNYYDSLRTAFIKVTKELNIDHTLHDLRSARATDLLNAGNNIYFVREYMRHKDIATTFKHYSKIDLDKQRKEMNKILSTNYQH